jgi:hypothetical protein
MQSASILELASSTQREALMVFFRSPAGLSERHAAFWQADLPEAEWLARLRAAPLAFRDDVYRLVVAAELCLARQAVLILVEGWRCHEVAGPASETVHGAEYGERILRLLHARGHLTDLPECWTDPQSRCTAEELHTALALAAARGGHLCGALAGSSCPSAARVRRYVNLGDGDLEVHNAWTIGPEGVLKEACRPRSWEPLYNLLFEGLNYAVYFVSSLEARTAGRKKSDLLNRLEVRLVQKHRKDRSL